MDSFAPWHRSHRSAVLTEEAKLSSRCFRVRELYRAAILAATAAKIAALQGLSQPQIGCFKLTRFGIPAVGASEDFGSVGPLGGFLGGELFGRGMALAYIERFAFEIGAFKFLEP